MAKPFEQDVILDVAGQPIYDAMQLVQHRIDGFASTLRNMGKDTISDVKQIKNIVDANIKALRDARSQLKTLQQEKVDRTAGFKGAEAEAKRIAAAETRADKEANKQRLIEAKTLYGEKARLERADADLEKQLAKEVAEYEAAQDRKSIASAREVAAARREAALAAVTAKARGITNVDDAMAAKAASDMRLAALRRERVATASNDAEAARGIAARIEVEKRLGRELDTVTSKLERQQAAAERRLNGPVKLADNDRLLAPGRVQDAVQAAGGDTRGVLLGYKFEQEAARQNLQTLRATKEVTDQQMAAAQRRLQIANLHVAEARRLNQEEEKTLATERRLAEISQRTDIKAQTALAPTYARETVQSVGMDAARADLKNRVAAAEARVASAVGVTKDAALGELAVERARLQAVEKLAAEQAVAGRRSIGGRVNMALQNTALYGVVAGAGYAIFNAMQQAVGGVIELEDEFAKLSAISNSTQGQMQELKASIFDVASTSRFSTLDLTKISQTLAQAGVSAGEMKDVLSSVTTLANASGSTPDEAVNLVTSALGAFQLQASETARVADLMTSALNRTKLTVAQVGQAIQYVGATAYEQNVSLETLLATVGAMAQAGIKSGSTIGTGLRQLFVDLQSPSEKLVEQLKAVGLTVADVNVAVNGEQQVLQRLKDAGFGATQAYAGLETRAAAAYLVLKNNISTIDELQLSFAQAGAATLANERAMDSLSAQWQRLKNIVSDDFFEGSVGGLERLKTAVRLLADGYEYLSGVIDGAKQRQKDYDYIAKSPTLFGAASAWLGDKMVSMDGTSLLPGIGPLIPLLDSYGNKTAAAAEAQEKMSRSINEANDRVSNQRSKVGEVEQEMSRLITQHASLSGNNLRTDAETVNLTSRFEGLAKYLTNAKDRYGDLINAMRLYNNEATKTLGDQLQSQILTSQQAEQWSLGQARTARSRVLANPNLLAKLSPQERAAVDAPRRGNNSRLIFDAARRTNDPALVELSQKLSENSAAISAGRIATTALNDTQARTGAIGQSLNDRIIQAEAGLKELDGLSGQARLNAAANLRNVAQGVASEAGGRANRLGPQSTGYNTARDFESRATAVLTGIKAALAPSKADEKASAAADREAARKPLISQADIDGIGKSFGLALGSGTRTPAEQEALHARGVTPARGFGPRTSNHVSGVARDFSVKGLSDAEAERTAAAMRAKYRDAGMEVQVKYERGGKNDGTGRHIHVGARTGARRSNDRTEQTLDQVKSNLAQSQIELDESDLKNKLKAIGQAPAELFEKSVKEAHDALDKVNSQLEEAAKDELATKGITAGVEFDAKMAQVHQTVEQNVEEYQQKVADAILKSTKGQIEAAQTAFDAAVAPAQAALDLAQSQSKGLEAFSLRNKVPDYVKSLANDRVSAAEERVQQAQLSALPAQIAAQQASIAAARATADKEGVTPKTTADLAQMNVELEKLNANRAALEAGLGAGALLPTNFNEGLQQAIQAYQQANDMTGSVGQMMIMNLGGAIDQVSSGLTGMFTSILDGSQSALGAFGNFAKGIMNYMVQIAAKAAATQVLNLLFKFAGAAIGGGGDFGMGGGSSATDMGLGSLTAPRFNGGPAPVGLLGGGEVTNGAADHDSVNAKLAKKEWVINSKAAESVGPQFMAQLNQHGSKALDSLQSMPQVSMKTQTETNVYVVPPEQKPSLQKNDVLVIMNDDMLNGDSKRLIQHIAREG